MCEEVLDMRWDSYRSCFSRGGGGALCPLRPCVPIPQDCIRRLWISITCLCMCVGCCSLPLHQMQASHGQHPASRPSTGRHLRYLAASAKSPYTPLALSPLPQGWRPCPPWSSSDEICRKDKRGRPSPTSFRPVESAATSAWRCLWHMHETGEQQQRGTSRCGGRWPGRRRGRQCRCAQAAAQVCRPAAAAGHGAC